MNTTSLNIQFRLVNIPPIDELGREWLELEARSNCLFFTSWAWIGCWLTCLPANIQVKLLRACIEEKTVGMCLLVKSYTVRHRLIPVKSLFLHSIGNSTIDDITIEHNSFLVDQTTQSDIIDRMYDYLVSAISDWDELHLDGVTENMYPPVKILENLRVKVKRKSNYYVNLEEVSTANLDYLALIGKSTRSNIRSSIRKYSEEAPLTFTAAESMHEALAFLSGLKKLHQAYWQTRGLPGSFANVFFENFHEKLIRSEFENGKIQLIRFNVGDKVLAYHYNFIHRNQIHTYQTGFDYSVNNKCNPGLVTNSLSIQYNATLGHKIYDLMAGDVQYKQALGTHSRYLSWIVLQRRQFKFFLEDEMRNIKGMSLLQKCMQYWKP